MGLHGNKLGGYAQLFDRVELKMKRVKGMPNSYFKLNKKIKMLIHSTCVYPDFYMNQTDVHFSMTSNRDSLRTGFEI